MVALSLRFSGFSASFCPFSPFVSQFLREAACIATVCCRSSQSSFGPAAVCTLLCRVEEAIRSMGVWCVSPAEEIAQQAVNAFVYTEPHDQELARETGLVFVFVCLHVYGHKTAHVGRFVSKKTRVEPSSAVHAQPSTHTSRKSLRSSLPTSRPPLLLSSVERQSRSAKRPSFSLSGKRKILRFARTGTHSFIPGSS